MVKKEIKRLQIKHSVFVEIKWKNVSPSKIEFFLELVDLFFSQPARFRCIVVDGWAVDLATYHGDDGELGFYKFYFQLLKNWIDIRETYWIYLDHKKNKLPDRLQIILL